MVDSTIFTITDEINKDYLILEQYGASKMLVKRDFIFIADVKEKIFPILNETINFIHNPVLVCDQIINLNGESYRLIPENNLTSSLPKAAKLLGRGSQGSVYVVEKYSEPGIFFAMKFFRQRAQGEYEAKTLDFLSNIPSIIKPITHGKIGMYHAILFNIYPESLIETKKKSISNSFHFLRVLLFSLNEIHEKGFIHGDIKPDNILLDEYGNPFLGDLGSSGPIGEKKMNFGTPSFRYPYTIDNRKSIDADVWALGITMLYFISRKRPFIDYGVRARFLKSQGRTFREKDILQAVEEENIPNMVSWMLKIEIHNIDSLKLDEFLMLNIIEKIIIRMLEKDKENRPSINELLNMMSIQKSE